MLLGVWGRGKNGVCEVGGGGGMGEGEGRCGVWVYSYLYVFSDCNASNQARVNELQGLTGQSS